MVGVIYQVLPVCRLSWSEYDQAEVGIQSEIEESGDHL